MARIDGVRLLPGKQDKSPLQEMHLEEDLTVLELTIDGNIILKEDLTTEAGVIAAEKAIADVIGDVDLRPSAD